MRTYTMVELELNEFIFLEYRNNVPFIRWIKNGTLVVDRPAYGAEEKLLLKLSRPICKTPTS